ncbi:MAG: ABC transporter permease [Planctomycetota bacterium]
MSGGRMLVLVRKELWSYLVNPVSYVILFLLNLYRGADVYNLVLGFRDGGDADLFAIGYLNVSSTLTAVVLLPPLLTMKAFAEEKRTGTFELLVTAPIQDHEIVLGKWLASWLFYGLLWLPSMLVLVVLQAPWFLGVGLPFGPLFTAYLGLFLLGSLLLAVGLFFSSLTDNQLLASLASILFGVGIFAFAPLLQRGVVDVDSDFLSVLADQLLVRNHLRLWFFRGLIDTGHLVFYVSTTALLLFLTVRSVEARKWR